MIELLKAKSKEDFIYVKPKSFKLNCAQMSRQEKLQRRMQFFLSRHLGAVQTTLKSNVPIPTFSVTLEKTGREQLREYLFVSILNKTGILTKISACNDKQQRPLIVNFIKLSKPQEQIISNFCNSSFAKEVSIELEKDQKCKFKIQFSSDAVQSIKIYINKYKNVLDVGISLSQLH